MPRPRTRPRRSRAVALAVTAPVPLGLRAWLVAGALAALTVAQAVLR
ncbi:MAG TPA: hypothetical protein VD838_20325 [Anaeromyxobacteraceae bacterium]|nr:hypothetical protein [Anaeromyxobacteraceae bacterium]